MTYGDTWSLVLDEDALDHAILNDSGVARRASVAEESSGVESETSGSGELHCLSASLRCRVGSDTHITGVVSEEVDDRVVLCNTKLLLPRAKSAYVLGIRDFKTLRGTLNASHFSTYQAWVTKASLIATM